MFSARPYRDGGDSAEQQVQTASIPASVKGWNARDSVADMPTNMALTLVNIFPQPTEMVVRQGSSFWTGGFAGDVKSLLVFRPQSGSEKMWATASTFFYNVTSSGYFQLHGQQLINVGSNKTSGSATGLANNATTYTMTVTVDGAGNSVNVTGSACQTYGDLITQINADLTGATASINSATFYYNGGNILIESSSSGATSTIAITDTGLVAALGGGLLAAHGGSTAPDVSGLTSGKQWQYVNFATSGTNYLMACNGTDSIRRYDTSNGWLTITGSGTGAITGVTTSTIINIAVMHSRIWLVPVNSNQVYYLGANAIAGAATAFDLGPLMTKGGYIVAAGGWAMDGGVGMQEYSVFLSDQGQAIVYQGYDPSNAALWSLVGVYDIGHPVGPYKCMKKLGPDLLILTVDGIVPASKGLMGSRTNQLDLLTSNIQKAITDAIADAGATADGWQMEFNPKDQQLLLNIPADTPAQFVMNTIHHAWCQFDWSAQCFDVFNDSLYFGTVNGANGAVMYSNSAVGTDPNINGIGSVGNISWEWQTSFQYFGNRTVSKEVVLCRPTMLYDNSVAHGYAVNVMFAMDVDYVVTTPTATMNLPTVDAAPSPSKYGAAHSSNPITKMTWFTGSEVGYAFAPHLLGSSNSPTATHFSAIGIVYRKGGVQVS